ncbi:MAG: hypothetical protein QOJ15_6010 [Bradyrhizobium sp.]|nr:hypothetical protein [Bradyrhizobium sp.]
MKCTSIVFAVIALVSGLLAAWFWLKSSKVKIGPLGPKWRLPGTGVPTEPYLPDQKAQEMFVKNMMDSQEIVNAALDSARLNKVASLWTAASVLCGGVASITGTLAS